MTHYLVRPPAAGRRRPLRTCCRVSAQSWRHVAPASGALLAEPGSMLPVKTWPIASKPTSIMPPKALRKDPADEAKTRRLGAVPHGRGGRIWRSVHPVSADENSGVSGALRQRRAQGQAHRAPITTPTVCLTVGWEESDGQRSVPGLPQRRTRTRCSVSSFKPEMALLPQHVVVALQHRPLRL